jgi:hypothetical protein
LKIAVLAPEDRLPPLERGLAANGYEVVTPNSPSVPDLVALVFREKPAAVVVAAGIEKAAYAPLAQVYAEGCGLVALAYPTPDAGTLATVAGALGGAVVYPRPNDEGKLTIPGEEIRTAIEAVTTPRPAWLEEAQTDPLFATAINAVLEHGGMYSSRLLQQWLHISRPQAVSLASRIRALPGASPPTTTAPGMLVLPQVSYAQKGAQALLRGALAAAKLPIRKPRRPHTRRKHAAKGGAVGDQAVLEPP